MADIKKKDIYAEYILRMLLCFPSLFIEIRQIMQLMESDTLSQNQIGKSLRFLFKKGWVLEDNNSFKLHPTIQLALYIQTNPTFDEYKNLVKNLHTIITLNKISNIN